jgi:aconitate hydratase
MGVLPLQFSNGDSSESLGLTGRERFTIREIASVEELNKKMEVLAVQPDGEQISFTATARIETPLELAYFHAGGLARKVLADL